MKQLDQNPLTLRQEIITLGKLTSEEIRLVLTRKTAVNRLGFTYQLIFVKIHNYFPKQSPFEIEMTIVNYAAAQISLPNQLITDYQDKLRVIRSHQGIIKAALGLQDFNEDNQTLIECYITHQAEQTDQVSLLVPKLQCYLKENHILQPALSTLRRFVGTYRDVARNRIQERIYARLTDKAKEKLAELLNMDDARSILWKLKQPPGIPSADNIKLLLLQLSMLDELEVVHLDLHWLNNNYKKRLTKYGRTNSAYYIRRMPEVRRYAILVCLCQSLYAEYIDYIIEMLIKLIDKAEKSARNQIDQATKQKRREIKQTLEQFKKISAIIIDEDIADEKLRKAIYKAVSKKKLTAQLEQTQQWLSGKYSHVFHLLQERHSYFRKFFPKFIAQINLCSDGTYNCEQLLQAVTLLKQLNQDKDNQLPDDAPTEFIPPSLSKFVIDAEGKANRHAWETAVLRAVRDELKQGNLSVKRASFFSKFEDCFMSTEDWRKISSAFFRAANLPPDAQGIPLYLKARLHPAIDTFVATENNNPYAKVLNEQWVLSVDDAQQLSEQETDDLARLREFLHQHMRKIKLPDLLIEVDNILHITNYFLTYQQRQTRDKEAIATVIAAMMSRGCGIGDSTMQHLVQSISYHALRTVGDLYLSDEDAQRYALRDVVDAMTDLDITENWGRGESSSSDSIRMEFQSKVLNRGFSTCYGDYAIEFYTFVADTYAPFFSKPIECTQRDSGHVLDGTLYNESSLTLLDHYVDTHGYMEINFTGFTFLGKRLNPRIKNVKDQRLYCIDPTYSMGTLAPLLQKNADRIDMDNIVEQYDMMGRFYASLQSGYTTASNAMRRLAKFSEKNNFYRANRDFGRIIKTENILQHMTDPLLREKRRRGLLKTEQLHQLSREVSYGKHGKITAREIIQLKNSCSCLTLIDACIVYWQAREMMRVCEEHDAVGLGLNWGSKLTPRKWSV